MVAGSGTVVAEVVKVPLRFNALQKVICVCDLDRQGVCPDNEIAVGNCEGVE
jgi:hypothetical protein